MMAAASFVGLIIGNLIMIYITIRKEQLEQELEDRQAENKRLDEEFEQRHKEKHGGR